MKPVILLYNQPFPGMLEGAVRCQAACEVTLDRRRLDTAAAVVFHVPTLPGVVLPAKRRAQPWVAWSMESRVNYPVLADAEFMRQFDGTMTYERRSDVWCPYVGPEIAADLVVSPRPKVEAAPLVYFQSSPVDRSGRVRYAFELMKRVKVDSYGHVLRNRTLAEPDRGRTTRLATMARYKFALVLENSIAPDYVTEKLFEALIAGAVPVYRGAPNVAELAPADGCFIDAGDFSGPAALAEHLNRVDQDDAAYARYLAWRREGPSQRFLALVEAVREPAFSRLCRWLCLQREASSPPAVAPRALT